MLPFIKNINESLAKALLANIGKRKLRMRQRWVVPVVDPQLIHAKAKMLRNGKTKLVRIAQPTARRVWEKRKYHYDIPYRRPGDPRPGPEFSL